MLSFLIELSSKGSSPHISSTPGCTTRPYITPSLFHLISLHTFLLTQLLPHPACQQQLSIIYLRFQAISATSMTTHSHAHWQGIVFCFMDSQSTLMLGINLLRQRQGFEMGIKDCVLTKKEQVFFFTQKL